MQLAGAPSAYIVIRDGKWDIPAYLGDGSRLGISIAYLMMNAPFGVPFTMDQAYSFLKNAVVLFGFPDVLFFPVDGFKTMLQRQQETRADIVLGLFEAPEPGKVDMVQLNEEGHIVGIEIKNPESKARYCWINAVWTPAFTEYLHRFVKNDLETRQQQGTSADPNAEIQIGAVLANAIQAGLSAVPVIFEHGHFLDIGTPADLLKATRLAVDRCGQNQAPTPPPNILI
jgi:glucose-1-phosphate thymidylyltransferase